MSLTSTQIVFHGLDYSAAMADAIRRHVTRLERYCPTLHSCRVSVEQPHRHHAHGRRFRVCIELAVSGIAPLAVERDESNVSLAIADAFAAARRRLQDAVRVQREAVRVLKSHAG
jgi:ribosome-associated translation inhibitor RaiA